MPKPIAEDRAEATVSPIEKPTGLENLKVEAKGFNLQEISSENAAKIGQMSQEELKENIVEAQKFASMFPNLKNLLTTGSDKSGSK